MFAALHKLTTQSDLVLNLSACGDNLRVVVIPKPKSSDAHAALVTPLVLTATPEELDQQFTGILEQYASSRKSLSDTLEETKTYLEAAEKSAKDKATAVVAKKTAPTTPPEQEEAKEKVEKPSVENNKSEISLF